MHLSITLFWSEKSITDPCCSVKTAVSVCWYVRTTHAGIPLMGLYHCIVSGSGRGDNTMVLWSVPGGDAVAAGTLQSPARGLAWLPSLAPQLLSCNEVGSPVMRQPLPVVG